MLKVFVFGLFLVCFQLISAQLPPRLQIPGAVSVPGARPVFRQHKINSINTDFIPRPRRPSPSPAAVRDVRPVIEEEEDYPPSSAQQISSFDAEVNKLSIPSITSAVRQTEDAEFQQPPKPEKPVPVTRDQIREKPASDFLSTRGFSGPVIRSEPRSPKPIRPVYRQDLEEEENIPRQPIRPKVRSQNIQPQYKSASRPKTGLDEDGKRKPTAQILRKYRTDNEDGSITWGFENDDGTFKEETLGTDCVIKGKYGYVDPDGVKREFSYEAGNKCDPNQVNEDELEEELRPLPPQKKSPVPNGLSRQQQVQSQIQYRPQLSQY